MTLNNSFMRFAAWLSFSAFCGSLALFSGLYLYLSPKLPTVETLRDIQLQTPLQIYSADNRLIGEFGEMRRTPITYEETPKLFIQAILAAEDNRFYSHHGVDIKGLMRAASQLLQSGQIQTGGSTITMQVARNFFLTRNQTFTRKFNEILLALQIERELNKEEILELYVNKIYLGNRAYGIQAAAQVYYGKTIDELDLAQLAMIAGLPKAPSAFNPIVNPSRALIRRDWILGRMLELDYIDKAAYENAIKQPADTRYHGSTMELDSPYVAEMARHETLELLGKAAYTDGYKVYTTVDSRLQSSAQRAVIDGLLAYDKRHGYRGPEYRLKVATGYNPREIPAPGEKTLNNTETSTQKQLKEWQTELKGKTSYGGLYIAVVTRTEERELFVMTPSGQHIAINWEHGLSSARPYINENSVGASPQSVPSFLAPGDVVRIRQAETGEWHFTQLPDAQAALVALNPKNGAIQALVGGFDFHQSHFNRATQAERQPGSNFKPFIYATALENGMTPATIINDAPIVFDDAGLENAWRPENDSGKFFGPTRLREALYKSRNLVSIRILQAIGVPDAIDSMARFGFDPGKLPRNLSLALGTNTSPPLQIATGYAVFANGGYQVKSHLIDRITDAHGKILYQSRPPTVCRTCEQATELDTNTATDTATASAEATAETATGEGQVANSVVTTRPTDMARPPAPRVMDATVAYLIDNILRDVIQKGTGQRAKVLGRRDLAGKTGTTNGPKDAWFSGYNGHIVATTWLGFDKSLPLGRGEYGGSAALPIWIDFMQTALDGVPETVREQPNGLITMRIDPRTGKAAQADNPRAIFEIFQAENAPLPPNGSNDTSSPYDVGSPVPEELF